MPGVGEYVAAATAALQAGLGRTPTIAIALLMQHELSLAEAHRMVLSARPEAAPTSQQLTWLEEVEARLKAKPK